MQIKIAERFKPFTHLPGQLIPIPKTTFAVRVFPEKVELYSLLTSAPKLIEEILFSLKGPVQNFTVTLDLEKGRILVAGKEIRGYFHYEILADGGPFIRMKKAPDGFDFLRQPCLLEAELSLKTLTRLSLGCSKKGDMTLLRRRSLLEEVLPYWFFLGQMIPPLPFQKEGTLSLLEKGTLKELFLAGFEGVFCPRTTDTEHQGFDLPKVTKEQSPLPILSEGAKLILSLFVEERHRELKILESQPNELHAGRLLDVPFFGGKLSLEWSKKRLKKVIIVTSCDGEVTLKVAKDLKNARFQNGARVLFPFGLQFKANETFVLDRFER